MNAQEIEVKFYLSNLDQYHTVVVSSGAQLVQPRQHEVNLRFDTPQVDLAKAAQVLRLRQDQGARLTYKGPGEIVGGVRVRQEIEFQVGDFQAAKSFLLALGYQVVMMYEKYRTTYDLDGVLITIDEMPYGNFTELEGQTPEAVFALSKKLGLKWEHRINDSYVVIFDRLKAKLNLDFRDLAFEQFQWLVIQPEMLAVNPGDTD